MLGSAKKKSWEELALADEPFELDADLDFVTPVGAPQGGAAPAGTPIGMPIGSAAGRGDFDVAAFEETYVGELARGGDQPVPRIAIQVFCERPATAQLLQAASTDRRLAKATVTVSMGGLTGAVDFFKSQSSPNLIIVESLSPPAMLIQQLDELASYCDEGVKVIVIGEQNDITLYRELMRRGVSEYLVPPLQPLQLIRAISGIYVDPAKPFLGKVVAFVGAKGGVGSSTVAHNIAYSIAEHARINTTLVDLDLSWGTTGLDFNTDPAMGVADALETPDRVDDVLLDRLLTRHSDQLTLFTAPGTLDRDYEIAADAYETVIDGVRRGVPFVVLDLPHTWTRWMRQTLMSADEVVIVAQPDLAGLRNAKNLFDMVKVGRPNDAPPKVVLNMVGVPKRPEIPVKDFADALGTEPALVLPYDPQLFGTASNNGQMVFDVGPQSKCAEGLDHLAQLLTGKVAAPKAKGSVLDKLKSLKIGK
jgi:pilus assembly protein CpaE